MNKFCTKLVCMALFGALCVMGLNAQELLQKGASKPLVEQIGGPLFASPNPEVSFSKPGECEPHGYPKDDAVLKYITGDPTVALGIASPTGTRYTSGCINFAQAQMYNYVGGTIHQINVGVAPLASMPTLVSYKIWIKTALDGPIVYQQSVTPTLDATYHWETYSLTTPYTITNAPLVIGFTAEFSGTSAFYPLACTNVPADTYKPGGFNYINAATSPTDHEAALPGCNIRQPAIWLLKH